jgi:16S rRNA (guanine527-N7)-methyltransferase
MTINILTSYLSAAGYNSPLLHARIEQYLTQLSLWNKTHNLTAITDPDEMVVKHILDSLSIATYMQGNKVLDVGTGAGLPGIPLAMQLPQQQFTLLDALSKRTLFLSHIKTLCQLDNIHVTHSRIEDFSKNPENIDQYDTVTCRAYAGLDKIVLQCLPVLKTAGTIAAMKGEYPTQELAALQTIIDQEKLTAEITTVDVINVQHLEADRHMVVITKL